MGRGAIRTVRMDEVAEKVWPLIGNTKGIKSESGMDEWLKNIREILKILDWTLSTLWIIQTEFVR